ncbi:uncharacterized protein LOC108674055 [Hyalella azteca]|uniref:Uncharacterized protein LOC108674055 n=1 Tax=Hyalella azteca TaxID=294128 RepID=A0A8B7NUN2_HYAAZ|nr:uncharacterized protein LOC108674055 [Hyalella azteca]
MRHGVWSAWSGWSECVPPCGSGQRIRYRYCDSPPPLNKGAYCQGNATAVTTCTNPACDLPAVTSTSSPSLPLDPRLRSCNCGCRLNVTSGHSLLLDLDTSSCRGNVSWLIKSPDGESVMAALSRASLLAGGQWVKVRDGNRSTSPLLLTLPTLPRHTPGIFLTTHMLMATTLTGIQEEKRWNKFNSEKNTFDPWWLIRSSSEWLRLEVHTLTNVSNETIIPHLGFTLLARPAGAMWPHHVEEELFVSKDVQAVGWISYASVVNFFALVFIAIILCLIVVFVVAYRFQYRVYRKSKMESDSLSDSFGSSSDLLEQQSSKRLPSLHTLAEVLSLASLSFGRRDTQSNYTQLTDRNCVPLRNKTGFTSMPSSPFCGRAPFMRAKNSRRCETNRRSASCEELESRFIFPIKEENVMTTSISEVEISSSCKEDSGNESPSKESAKKLGKKSLIKKPQTIKGSFAYVTKVKDLNGSRLREKNSSSNSPKIPSHLKLNLKNTGNGRRQSPITVGKISSIATAHASSTSELSMTGADLEFDYYDYNMDNASAVPGSLFGLDPTLMPWLPSILNIDEIDEEDDIYTSTRHPFSVSVSTLTRDDEVKESIPLQDMASLDGRAKTTGLAENSDMSASKAISLSSSDNSDEIKFADDSGEE